MQTTINAQVTAIRWQDVRGKELLYVKIVHQDTGKEVVINVGKATLEGIEELHRFAESTKANEEKAEKLNEELKNEQKIENQEKKSDEIKEIIKDNKNNKK